jgi:hypothetical protein
MIETSFFTCFTFLKNHIHLYIWIYDLNFSADLYTSIYTYKIGKNRIPKGSPHDKIDKCCTLGLIKPVHGRYKKVQVTVHVP